MLKLRIVMTGLILVTPITVGTINYNIPLTTHII